MKTVVKIISVLIIASSLIVLYFENHFHFLNTKYNLILITIDTLRADHLSCYGYRRLTTPNIDKLAKNGVIFKSAYTQIPLTLPSCASIMTSLYPAKHGIKNNFQSLNRSFVTFAGILKKNNYNTMAIVNTVVLKKENGLSKSFDFYMCERGIADRVTRLFTENIKNLKKPFFVWLHYFDPHGPYALPSSYQNLYEGISSKEAWELNERRKQILLGGKPTEAALKKLIALYDGEIHFVDDEIGKILDLVKKLGLTKNTIIIVTADHGEGFEHNYFLDHGDRLYEEELRVPFIIWGPKDVIPEGKIVYETVRLIDIMPTSLDMLKINSTDNNFHGTSLLPVIKNLKPLHLKVYSELAFRPKYVQAKSNMVSLRDGDWKLIVHTDNRKIIKAGSQELYNILKDPYEKANLAEVEKDISFKLCNDISNWIETMSKNAFEVELNVKTEAELDQLRSLEYIN